jgi:filamentous hemagglutinin family protein
LLAASGIAARAQAPATFSPAWFAALRGAGAAAHGGAVGGASVQATPQTMQQVEQSLANMAQAARAIAAIKATQSQAQATAAALNQPLPNGLTAGGLQPSAGYNQAGSSVWRGVANPAAPVAQSTAGGRTQVTITQTAPQAILNWQTFNIGANTTLTFNQSAGGAAAGSWTVLNRVTDPAAQPSVILGQINAQGKVYIVNANGILFGSGAQINTAALIAAAATISDQQFLNNGIYSPQSTTGSTTSYTPSFTAASGDVVVQAGAQITTSQPLTAIDAGGYVMLIGRNVSNAGVISTPAGQTILAAGSDFVLRPGVSIAAGSTTPSISTTLGTEIDPVSNAGPGLGAATNTGLIQATTGDITLAGGSVTQAGVAYATTSVAQRGTIHLLTNTADPNGSVTLAPGSLTLIAPDDAGAPAALDAQRSSDLTTSAAANSQRAASGNTLLGNQVALPDQSLQSRIEITAGSLVDFQPGSLTMAQGGQIAVSATNSANPAAGNRILVETGARLDVSGVVGVTLPASATAIAVDIQGFQLRDSPQARDSGTLDSITVYVDANELVPVAQGSVASGYTGGTRYYTPGGLLEVSGEYANTGHGIGEWASYAGSIFLSTQTVVAQPGSGFNISGGSVNYQAGMVPTSWLLGSDGHVYNVNQAPSYLTYSGLYTGFTVSQPRWNISTTYTNPLIAPSEIYQPAYTVGHDAGTLIISAPTAIFEGTVSAGVVNGTYQNANRAGTTNTPYVTAATDPFLLAPTAVPLGGSLLIGAYNALGQATPSATTAPTEAAISDGITPVAAGITATSALPASRQDTALIPAGVINGSGLASVSITALAAATVDAPVTLAPGGQFSLTAPTITIGAAVSARGGSVTLGNEFTPAGAGAITAALSLPGSAPANVILLAGGVIETMGMWTNAEIDPFDVAGEAYVNGGSVSVRTTGGITLAAGSVIDASAGGALLARSATQGGSGGDITLSADDTASNQLPGTAPLVLAGTLRAVGVTQGGALSLAAPAVVIGAAAVSTAQLSLPAAFFQQGFGAYTINGYGTAPDPAATIPAMLAGVAVAPGTNIAVVEPVYTFTAQSALVPTGRDPAAALTLYTPPLYLQNPKTAVLTERSAASLSLVSSVPNLHVGGAISIGAGAAISLDPGATITVEAFDQITIDGTLRAPGGAISVLNDRVETGGSAPYYVPGLSVWIGGDAVLDVAAQAATATDLYGRPYGVVPAGGTITLGSAGAAVESDNTTASTEAFVFVRPGAVLDASGTTALIDPSAGPYPPANALNARTGVAAGAQPTPSSGGTIALSSYNGIFVDGALRAAAGGPGAAGGTLSVTLETPTYDVGANTSQIPNELRSVHRIEIAAAATPAPLPADLQPGDPGTFAGGAAALLGQARLGADQIAAGGFDTLLLHTHDLLLFDGPVTLRTGQSIQIVAGEIADTQPNAAVTVAAPYLLVSGAVLPNLQSSATTDQLADGPGAGAAGADFAITAGAPYSKFYPPCLSGAAPCAGGTLTFQGDLIDIRNQVRFGVDSTIVLLPPGPGQPVPAFTVDYPGFNTVSFFSSGDIRFLASTDTTVNVTDIAASGNVTFSAAQVYPVTGAAANVFAGLAPFQPQTTSQFYPAGTLSVGPAGGAALSPPLSAYGQLGLFAANVVQGGDVEAPLGALYLGISAAPPNAHPVPLSAAATDALGTFPSGSVTTAVTLLANSVTSTSAAGVSIPFGGTTDGVTYTLPANLSGTLPNNISGIASPVPGVLAIGSDGGVAIGGQTITVAAGATLNLSGGGVLAGAGFVSGRGGSTDTLATPLGNLNISASTAANNDAVYAIVPSYQGHGYAPVPTAGSAVAPGAEITLAAGIPGLPAGTYTLLPSIYALQPGAFRVELGAGDTQFAGSYALANGSYQVAGTTGTAHTTQHSVTPSLVTLTPGATVRTYSSYDEETYNQFLVSNAGLTGALPPAVPQDAKVLELEFYPATNLLAASTGTSSTGTSSTGTSSTSGSGTSMASVAPPASSALSFDGTTLFQPAAGGQGGTTAVLAGSGTIEITAAAVPTPEFRGVSIAAPALDAIGGARLIVGLTQEQPGSGASSLSFRAPTAAPVILRNGATLSAASVILGGSSVTLEPGSAIDTIGQGTAPFDAAQGYVFNANGNAIVAASNGTLLFVPTLTGGGAIGLGVCASGDACPSATTALYAGGSLNILTQGALAAGSGVSYGAQSITLNVPSINIGSDAALASAVVPPGFTLTQSVLAGLLGGNPAAGTPALQQLNLTASQSLNFFGTVTLNTAGGSGGAGGLQLVLATPAIYGYGQAGDVATLSTGTLIWSGVGVADQNTGVVTSLAPGPVYANGPGSGSGTLNLVAQQIVLGYPADAQAQSNVALARSIFGFANVNLVGTQEISANNRNTLNVYQSQGAYTPATLAYASSGGTLTLTTPLLTGGAGSTVSYTAGGAITIAAPSGAAPSTAAGDGLGAEIDLSAASVNVTTAIALPAGKLAATALAGDIALGPNSRIDLSGPLVALFDQAAQAPGGSLVLEAQTGNVLQDPTGSINVGSAGSNAGSISATALAGSVTLAGSIGGAAPAGSQAGTLTIRTGTLTQAAFDDLNARLNAGGVFGGRSIEVTAGDLAVNNAGGSPLLQAQSINIATDSGSLTVNGTINASGPSPGNINLSAGHNLTLAAGALLDAHGTILQTDSTGAPIAAENTGTVTLTVAGNAGGVANAGTGVLTLAAGASINLTTPDNVARGDIELNVPRTGSASGGTLGIAAGGPLSITGAATVAVNGFWTYVPSDGKVLQYQANDATGIGLDTIDADSRAFIAAAEPGGTLNATLAAQLAGLTGPAFHLRPGVEIDSPAATGTLIVQGDLDLSPLRYGPGVNPAVPGSGEPGVLVLRAAGNLDVYGSISDGFAHPPVTPDDSYFVLYSGTPEANGQNVVLPVPLTLVQAQYSNTTPLVLNYPITVTGNALDAGTVLPTGLTLSAALTVPGFVATAPITSATGSVLYAAGAVVPAGTLAAGDVLAPGLTLPVATPLPTAGIVWPAGASLTAFANATVAARNVRVPAGGLIPSGTVVILNASSGRGDPGIVCTSQSCTLRPAIAAGQTAGDEYAIAPMLPAGDLSWSLRLVAGANLAAADTGALAPATTLAAAATPANPAPGSIVLSDLHYLAPSTGSSGAVSRETEFLSVVRTGTGSLDLLAGGDIDEQTLYGIYTAGTQSQNITSAYKQPRADTAGGTTVLGPTGTAYENLVNGSATSVYQANYPTGGGNVLVTAQGSIAGDIVADNANTTSLPDSNAVGNWLWRQGGNGVPTAWWINFGTYVLATSPSGIQSLTVAGFSGIGALGGGNVSVSTGGDAGYTTVGASTASGITLATTGLDIAVGGSGQVQGGTLIQTGGGNVSLTVGGRLNPGDAGVSNDIALLGTDLNGTLTDLRGAISVNAGAIGIVVPDYLTEVAADPRQKSPFVTEAAQGAGGPVIIIGDGRANLFARGDVVLSGVGDPTREAQQNGSGPDTWFSLWTPQTAINLFAAGGNLVPIVEGSAAQSASVEASSINAVPTDDRYIYPPVFAAVAASGNIFAQAGADPQGLGTALELAPSPSGQLALLAGGSIYDLSPDPSSTTNTTRIAFDISGANPAIMATPFNPAFQIPAAATTATTATSATPGATAVPVTNALATADTAPLSLFTFGADTVTTQLHAGGGTPARFYAVGGDVLNLLTGETLTTPDVTAVDYLAAIPVRIEAGRDIVATGTAPGAVTATADARDTSGDLFLNDGAADISALIAGRDILYANVTVDGPGQLLVQAGRNLYQGNQGLLQSGGPLENINPGTRDGGAGITALVGVGSNGPDWSDFAAAYLNPANLANPQVPLQDQPGRVERTYAAQLLAYLQQQTGYTGTAADAPAAFGRLPAAQQDLFLLQIYFAELNQSGLDYNNPASLFYHSYLEGNRAIATLFPATDLTGQSPASGGSITLFGASGIITQYGGGIQLVVPNGATTLGVTGSTQPPSTAGVLTQGSGAIDIYSYGSVELGQSRIFTTFGGDILVWMSSNGEINAGRGASSTVVFSPEQISYDNDGSVTLSPTVPTTGAGIATLAPIASIPPGSINLIAPVGTIDAGEAGIRASGNANLAALTVLNASNIQSQGRTTGLPVVAVPNVAAEVAASSAAAAGQNAAQQQATQSVANATPQINITVEVTGFGGN